ncbi:MAG: hypothetical protein WBA82_12710 [Castellaniella sp.]
MLDPALAVLRNRTFAELAACDHARITSCTLVLMLAHHDRSTPL